MRDKILLLCLLNASLWVAGAGAQQPASLPTVIDDQLIVGFVPGTPGLAMADAHRQAGATAMQTPAAQMLAAINATVVQVAPGNVSAAISAYERNPNVRYAEPNYLRAVIPNEGQDPPWPMGLGIDYFDEQYGLHNTGQSFYYDRYTGVPGAVNGVADADIDAPEAWELDTGSSWVVVAVLDSGVDCAHADLAGKCVEEINLGPSLTLTDDIGHGTHVAGIAAATGNNGIGVAGVGWNTSIAAIKVCYEEYDFLYGLIGLCDAAASAAGMIHAADQGYHVVNMSYAGPDGSVAEQDAAAYAASQGVVLVAAAANSYTATQMYPAAFTDVIAVAATDWFDNLASFSTFGNTWVSLAAPGAAIFSTMPHAACGISQSDPEGCYGWLSGTSMASPTVAGAAAVVWSYLAGAGSGSAVRTALEANADVSGALGQNMLAWTQNGRLNLFRALENAGGGAPPPLPGAAGPHVSDLEGSSINAGSAWIAEVVVTVHDEFHSPLSGVAVSGSWGLGLSGGASCSSVTNVQGQCTISSPPVAKKNGVVEFTVGNLSGGGSYDSGANHDADGDSNGTTITIVK